MKHIYAFKNYGKLLVKNGTINARGIYNYGEIIVESGVINAIDGDGGYSFRNYDGAKLTLNGGTVATTLEDDHKSDKGGYDATPVQVDAGATFVMNGGVINNVCDFTSAIVNYGSTIINGGEITSIHTTIYSTNYLEINDATLTCNAPETTTRHTIYVVSGNAIINGGTFKNTAKDQSATGGSVINGNIEVNAGHFVGRIEAYYGTPVIKGGTFTVNPTRFVQEGYIATFNEETSLWVVSAK